MSVTLLISGIAQGILANILTRFGENYTQSKLKRSKPGKIFGLYFGNPSFEQKFLAATERALGFLFEQQPRLKQAGWRWVGQTLQKSSLVYDLWWQLLAGRAPDRETFAAQTEKAFKRQVGLKLLEEMKFDAQAFGRSFYDSYRKALRASLPEAEQLFSGQEVQRGLQKLSDSLEISAQNDAQILAGVAEILKRLEPRGVSQTNRVAAISDTKPIFEVLPSGQAGRAAFDHLVQILSLLAFRKKGEVPEPAETAFLPRDSSADLLHPLAIGNTLVQVSHARSPFSAAMKKAVSQTLALGFEDERMKPERWVLVTPGDLAEKAAGKTRADSLWFKDLETTLQLSFPIEFWGDTRLKQQLMKTPLLCLSYYPELVAGGVEKVERLRQTRREYDDNLILKYRRINFVGMSVLKEEAAKGLPMERIYMPLELARAGEKSGEDVVNPLELLSPGRRSVILGDPGSGKSTLVKFLALAGIYPNLKRKYRTRTDERLPVVVILREYAERLRENKNLALLDYLHEAVRADFCPGGVAPDFFKFYLIAGRALLFFDGLDELPSPQMKEIVRDRVNSLAASFPGNSFLITSREVGYDEIRFDDRAYNHFRVAPLAMPQIQAFVEDWYAVRLEHRAERGEHVEDLLRILNDPDQEALRTLAKNPLLLTILTLVHRIDAVLPDQRVVLYQKCTETLLVTWHDWKYRQAGHQKNKREERYNRRRMEAIAHWMHGRASKGKDGQRALAPYPELHGFLTGHIEDKEKIPPDLDAEDLAEEFLRFVKEKAGLMIEAGDRQYSFIHLTFQEYLTAVHIQNRAEKEGIAGVWRAIRKPCRQSSWHEVVRLLISGLQLDENQEYLIEKILETCKQRPSPQLARLLGGILLDNPAPAEDHAPAMLTLILEEAMRPGNGEDLQALLKQLTAWRNKETRREELLEECFRALWAASQAPKDNLALLATCLGWREQKLAEWFAEDVSALQPTWFPSLICARQSENPAGKEGLKRLDVARHLLSLSSDGGNFIAALLRNLDALFYPSSSQKLGFEMQMVAGLHSGPTSDFTFNLLCNLFLTPSDLKTGWELKPRIGNNFERFFQARARARDRALARALARDRDRALAWARDRARDRDRALAWARDRALASALKDRKKDFLRASLEQNEALFLVVDLILEALKLSPTRLWREALVTRLPHVLVRARDRLLEAWRDCETAFAEGKALEGQHYLAGEMLLFDAGLYLIGALNSVDESPFRELAEQTRTHESPPLRIAHCLRDLAYGDASRADDLVAMVHSQDPAYRDIFVSCYWIEA